MNTLRKTVVLILLMILMVLGASLTTAKGMTNHIIVTAPDGEEIVVRDPALTILLSMASLEDFESEVKPVPEKLPEPYVLQRQWDDGDNIMPIDVVEFYPVEDGGIIKFRGLVNGSTGYDGNYYAAKPEAVVVMQNLFEDAARIPHLILTNPQGELHVYSTDLEPVTQVQLHKTGQIMKIQPRFNGDNLFYTLHGAQEPLDSKSTKFYAVDVNRKTVCYTLPVEFYLDTPGGREFVKTEGSNRIIISNVFGNVEYGEYKGEDGHVFRWGLPEFELPSQNTRLFPDESRSLIYGIDVRDNQLEVHFFELGLQSANSHVFKDRQAIGHYTAAWATEFVGEFYVTNGLTMFEFEHFFGTGMYRARELEWNGRATVEQESGVAEFAGVRDHIAYLYIPYSSGMTLDESASGLHVINTSTGKQTERLIPEMFIMDAVMVEDVLYVVGEYAKGGEVALLAIDTSNDTSKITATGAVTQRADLAAQDWLITGVKAAPHTFDGLTEVKYCTP